MIGVNELAARLSVSAVRARELVRSGNVPAQRVGGRWMVDEADVPAPGSRRNSRPLSARSAWGLIQAASGEPGMNRHPMERARYREWLKRLESSEDPAGLLASWLGARARRESFSANSADIGGLREDPRIRLSGVSHPAAGLLPGREVEGYVAERELNSLRRDWLLVDAPVRQANVIFHVVSELPDEITPLLIAADLAERGGPREKAAAARLIRDIHAAH